jgi:ribonucleoside-diphosphate reductase alpha chain
MNPVDEPDLSDNARRIFDLRYSRKDEEGRPTETPAQAIERVATNVAIVGALYTEASKHETASDHLWEEYPYRTALRQHRWLGLSTASTDVDWSLSRKSAEEYRGLLIRRDFIPNSPTWTGAGTGLGQLAACFVLPIEDDLGGEPNGIFDTLREAVLIQQTGGGNGFSFGRLRPKDSVVRASMGKASGPVGFLKAFDSSFDVIAQGGTRRGANMGVLPVSHPDIEEFVAAKVVEGELSNFNISVAITDDFMDAVDKDADFDLVHNGVVYRTIRARDLWDTLVEDAWTLGDPGCLFIDAANRENPLPMRYSLESTNPCGEQWLGPHENCCLGSINLANFVYHRETGMAFDWERFSLIIRLSTEFLDDVIDANQYVPKVPRLEEAAQGARRIGLGAMGLADAMAMLGIRYGSPEGQEFAAQVTEFMRYHTMLASIDRAKERGPFGWHEASVYDANLLREHGEGAEVTLAYAHKPGIVRFRLWRRPEPLSPYLYDFSRPPIDWSNVRDGIIAHGIRNAAQLTYAPTGTISNIADLQGSGCEPFFGLVYDRHVMQEGEDIVLSYLNPVFEQALVREGFTEAEREDIMEQVRSDGGSCQRVEMLPQRLRDAFVVAADVTPEEHVQMQASIQAFVDNSISKTINLPKEATVEDVAAVYRLAYDLGCKGITIYRQGSREVEVLTTTRVEVIEAESEDPWPTIIPLPIPEEAAQDGLPARVFPVETAFGKVQVTITEHPKHPGRPFDIRAQLGKAGNDKNADVEAIGRMISGNMRAGVSVTWIVDQLEGIGGSSVLHGFGDNRVRSVADGIAKLLRRHYLPDDLTVEGQVIPSQTQVDPARVCPKCHNATLVMDSGCQHCEVRLGGCGLYEGCE